MFEKLLKAALNKSDGEDIKTPIDKPLSPELLAEGRKITAEQKEALGRAIKEMARLDSLKRRWWTQVEEYYDAWEKDMSFDPETGVVSVVTKKKADGEDEE